MQSKHLERYTESQQRDINLVCVFLQVQTLADLSDPQRSSSILLSTLDGTRSESWSNNTKWPRQNTPTPHQRRLWKRYIRSSYLRYVPYWKNPPLAQGSVQEKDATPAPTSFENINTYVQTLPRSQQRLLADLQQLATDLQIWRAFRSKEKLYIASDGGLDGCEGTHGWVLATRNVDGFVSAESSTRSELAGCASSLLLVTAFSRMWGLRHRCSFVWITESKAAISRIRKYALAAQYSPARMPDDADLISLISQLLRELRRPFRPDWVKGHQDTLQSYDALPWKARLNIDADFLATRYRLRGRLRSSSVVLDHQDSQKVSISINGKRLTSQYDSFIRYHINGYHLWRFMQDKHQWSDATWDEINFGNFGRHFKRLRSSRQVTQMKRVHGQLPIGQRRYDQSRIKDPTLKLCPCCKLNDESYSHLLRCSSNPGYNTSLRQLRQALVTKDTHPLRYLLVEGIEHWTTSTSQFAPDIHQYPSHLRVPIAEALESQSRIGWEEAISELLSKSRFRLSCLDMYNTERTDTATGLKRMRSCMNALYDHATRMWTARNEILHTTGDDEQELHIRSAEIAEIRLLHKQPHLLRPGDRHYCERSLERLVNGSASIRRRWLRRVRRSIEDNKLDGGSQSLITNYFSKTAR